MGSARHCGNRVRRSIAFCDRVRPLDLATVAGMTGEELTSQLEVWHRFRAVADGSIVQLARRGDAPRGLSVRRSRITGGLAGRAVRPVRCLGPELRQGG